jgi:hypothetical protein
MIYAVRSNGASDRPEPRASNIPRLGAWTRITGSPLADHGKKNVAGVPRARGRWLERLPTRDSQHQSADQLVAVNRRLVIMRVRNWKTGKTPPTPWSASYTVTKNMLLLPDMTSLSQLATVQSRVSDLPV